MFNAYNKHFTMTQFAYEKFILIIFWFSLAAREKNRFPSSSVNTLNSTPLCCVYSITLFFSVSSRITWNCYHIKFFFFHSLSLPFCFYFVFVIDSSLALWRNDAFIIQSFSHPINRYFDIANTTRHQVEHARATNSHYRTNKLNRSGECVGIKSKVVYADDIEPFYYGHP